MSDIGAYVTRMIELGVSPAEAATMAAELFVAGVQASTYRDDVRPRSTGAERQARYRERNKASQVTVRDGSDVTTVTERNTDEVPLSPAPLSLPTSEPSKKTPKGVQKGSLVAKLSEVVTPDMAEALIAHRKAKKAPLTDKAAELLAKRLAQCPDPMGAAALMIEKGWQSIDPSWMPVASMASQQSAPVQAVFVERGSAAWAAWAKHRGKEPLPTHYGGREGQWMPTEFPPEEKAA